MLGSSGIKEVRDWLAHKSIVTTMRYAHINDGRMVATMTAFAKTKLSEKTVYAGRAQFLFFCVILCVTL